MLRPPSVAAGPYSGVMGAGIEPEGRDRREPSDADVAREWQRITAGLPDLADLSGLTERENLDPPAGTEPPDEADGNDHSPSPSHRAPSPPALPTMGEVPGNGSGGPRDYVMPEDDPDEGYTPPDPPHVGVTDPLPTLAWILGLGGPVVTVLLLIFWTAAPGWIYLTAAGASIAGWLVLFWRMPKARRDEDGNNGAVL